MSEPTKEAISRELLGKVVDQVFGGAIEDASVIEEIYAVIAPYIRTQAFNDALEIVANVAAQYPIAAFPENSRSVDASSARMARLVCKVIASDIRAMKVPT